MDVEQNSSDGMWMILLVVTWLDFFLFGFSLSLHPVNGVHIIYYFQAGAMLDATIWEVDVGTDMYNIISYTTRTHNRCIPATTVMPFFECEKQVPVLHTVVK